MKRHLDKKKKCIAILENINGLTDEDIQNLSLEKQKMLSIKKNNKNIDELISENISLSDINDENIDNIDNKDKYNKTYTNTTYLDNNNINKIDIKEEIYKSTNNTTISNDDDSINYSDEDDKYLCDVCYRYFSTKSNLTKHKNRKICKMMKKDIIINNKNEINNQHINNQQTINIININMNGIKGFDEEWDVSKIDIKKKIDILLSKYKFSKTLDNILSNDANLNVIINNDSGVVYKSSKNKYEPMAKKEIMEKSMDKIYKHLKDFYEEIKESDIKEYSDGALDILSNEYNDIELKYKRYNKIDDSKFKAEEALLFYYNKIKAEAEKKYHQMIEDEDINKY